MQTQFTKFVECGTDEAGRGCLAGPVTAAAVILPPSYSHALLTDSKKLTVKQRTELRKEIEQMIVCFREKPESTNADETCTHRDCGCRRKEESPF